MTEFEKALKESTISAEEAKDLQTRITRANKDLLESKELCDALVSSVGTSAQEELVALLPGMDDYYDTLKESITKAYNTTDIFKGTELEGSELTPDWVQAMSTLGLCIYVFTMKNFAILDSVEFIRKLVDEVEASVNKAKELLAQNKITE